MKLYIDGENCRKGLTRILKDTGVIQNSRELTKFRLKELLEDVVVSNEIEVFYYASEIRLPNGYQPSPDVMQHVQVIKEYSRKWVPELKKQGINYIKAGNLKVKTAKECRNCHDVQEVLQEKGVDVKIAVDMLEEAYHGDSADTLILMSSDTDLCPVLHKIKYANKKIIYVAFADSINRAISAVANQTITIPVAKIKSYYQ